jgi:hypothetical protein
MQDVVFHLSTVVFGQRYIRSFLDVSLPSELASGNLPALAGGGHVYHLFCLRGETSLITSSSPFKRLAGLLEVKIHEIDSMAAELAVRLINKYDLMTACYQISAREAGRCGAGVVALWADTILSNGTLARLLELARGGTRCVAVACNQVSDDEALRNDLRPHYRCADVLDISPRALVRATIEHLSPAWHHYFVDQPGYPDNSPSLMAWRIENDGLLVRSHVLHPILAYPLRGGELAPSYGSGLDCSAYYGECSANGNEIHIVDDSDEFCLASLDNQVVVRALPEMLNTVRLATFLNATRLPHTKEFLARKIRYHSSDLSDRWGHEESRSDRFVESIFSLLDVFDREPSLHADLLKLVARDHTPYSSQFCPEYLIPRVSDLVEGWITRKKRLVVYGAGSHTLKLFEWTNLKKATITAIVDSSSGLSGRTLFGHRVRPPSDIERINHDVILISSASFQDQIYDSLRGAIRNGSEVVRLYHRNG